MNLLFQLTAVTVALLADFLLGNLGLPSGLLGFVLFYLVYTGSPTRAALGAIFFGTVLDLTYGRISSFTPLLLLTALAAAWSVCREQPNHLPPVLFAGAVLGLFNPLGALLTALWFGGADPDSFLFFWQLIFYGVCGAALFPATVFLLDGIAAGLELPRFFRNDRRPSYRHQPRLVRSDVLAPNRNAGSRRR